MKLVKKAAKYYKKNKEGIKEKPRNKYKNLTKEEKELKRQYSRIATINQNKNIKDEKTDIGV